MGAHQSIARETTRDLSVALLSGSPGSGGGSTGHEYGSLLKTQRELGVWDSLVNTPASLKICRSICIYGMFHG